MRFRGGGPQRALVTLRATAIVLALLLTAACADDSPGREGAASQRSETASIDSSTTTTTLPPEAGEVPWTGLGEPGIGGLITDLWVDPQDGGHVLAGGDLLGVGVTRNRRDFVRSRIDGYEINRFSANPDGSVLWVGTMSGPYKSLDGGVTWTSRREGFPQIAEDHYSAPVDVVLVDPTAPNHLVALTGSQHYRRDSMRPESIGNVWRSDDGGASWREGPAVERGANLVAAVVLADGSMIVAAEERGIFRSDPGSDRWTRVSAPGRWVSSLATSSSDPNSVWATYTREGDGVPGGILRSEDGGRTWVTSNTGLTQFPSSNPLQASRYSAVAASPSDPSRVYTADSGWATGHIFRSDDGGRSWRSVLDNASLPKRSYQSGLGVIAMVVDPTDPDRVLLASEENLLSTSDGGQTWADIANREVDGGYRNRGFSGLVATSIAFSSDDPKLMMVAGFDGANVLRSSDGGKSWTRPLASLVQWGGAYAVVTGEGGSAVAMLGQDGTFGGAARSSDGGATWAISAGRGSGLPDAGATNVGAAGLLWLGGKSFAASIGGDLLRSDDGGATWSTLQGAIGAGALAVAPDDRSRLYVSTARGIGRSLDGGRNLEWIDGLPGADSQSVELAVAHPDRTIAGAEGDSVYVAKWRTNDGGLWRFAAGSWSKLRDDPYVKAVAVDPFDSRSVVVTTTDHPYHDWMGSTGAWLSDDGGDSFAQLGKDLPMSRVGVVAFDPHERGHVVAGTEGAGFVEIRLR